MEFLRDKDEKRYFPSILFASIVTKYLSSTVSSPIPREKYYLIFSRLGYRLVVSKKRNRDLCTGFDRRGSRPVRAGKEAILEDRSTSLLMRKGRTKAGNTGHWQFSEIVDKTGIKKNFVFSAFSYLKNHFLLNKEFRAAGSWKIFDFILLIILRLIQFLYSNLSCLWNEISRYNIVFSQLTNDTFRFIKFE